MKKMIPILIAVLFISGGISAQEPTVHRVLANNSFTIGWTPCTNCENYEVDCSINGGEYATIQEVTTNQVVTQLLDEKKALYRVRGFIDAPEGRIVGPYSDESDIIYGIIPPSIPEQLKIYEVVLNFLRSIFNG